MSTLSRVRTPPQQWSFEVKALLAIVGFEILLLLGYLGTPYGSLLQPRYAIYPFVWINVVLWVAMRTQPTPAPRRQRAIAAVLAGAYFLLLANWGGLFELAAGGHHGLLEERLGFQISNGSPGVAGFSIVTRAVVIEFIPYRVIGYFGLAYLVYDALVDVTGAVASGAIGLFSCLSCSFPIVASMVTSVWGGSVSLMSTVYVYSMDLSTLAFLVSVALLYYRPGFVDAVSGDDE